MKARAGTSAAALCKGAMLVKTVIVMRHGKAMPSAPGQQDIDRTLSKAGALALGARLPYMLRLLETQGRPAQIWASPAKRARQTAELLEKALKNKGVQVEGKIETFDCLWRQDVDAFLADLYATDAELVFVVGHIPFVEEVIEDLAGATPIFSTGGMGCLEVHLAEDDTADSLVAQNNARLLWFVQGPVAAHWATMLQLQDTITKTAEAIEDRRKAFFADPDDIETIHRFRTNSRTLRSMLAFIKPWHNREENAEAQVILRDIVRHTSRLRELDVFEKQAKLNPDSSKELLAFCKAEAAAERAKVRTVLQSKQVTRSFERAMELAKDITWRRRYVKHGLPDQVVRARFDALIESVSADLAVLKLSDAELTHDVRKRAKRARYVSELNPELLGPDAVDIAKGMMAHQDNLGDVCDARANIRLINEFLERDLPETVVWELTLLRAQNETFLYSTLKAAEAK